MQCHADLRKIAHIEVPCEAKVEDAFNRTTVYIISSDAPIHFWADWLLWGAAETEASELTPNFSLVFRPAISFDSRKT